jgi:hypothetical protein
MSDDLASVGVPFTTKKLDTYRRDDGEDIAGEYSFVTGLEWFETDGEPTLLVHETWVLTSRKFMIMPPPQDCEEDEP